MNSSKAQAVGSHVCMHKAHRLLAGGESVICASGLLALHQSYAAEPKRAINLHAQLTQQTAGPQAAWFQSQGHCQI